MQNKIFLRVLAIIALVAFLGMSFISVIPMRTEASSAQDKLKDAQAKQNELKNKINDTKSKISVNSKEKRELDSAIGQVQAKLDNLNSQISESNEKISKKQAELDKAQKESKEQYDSYIHRAKTMVEKGSITYLEVLLNSKSFSDLLSRYSVVKQIVKYDSEKLEELKKIEQQIESIKNELEGEKAKLVALKEDETAQMSTLSQKRAQSQQIIDDLKKDQSSYERALEEQERAEANARAEIKRLAEAAERKSQGGASGGYSKYSGSMIWPSSGPVTSPYYMRVHPVTGKLRQHTGIDIGSPHGSNIVAASSGTVIVAGYNAGGYGNYVVISHGSGISTLYAHASALLVSTGQSVSQGQVIAKVGSTGMSTGPHLHFEVLVGGQHTNPMSYLP